MPLRRLLFTVVGAVPVLVLVWALRYEGASAISRHRANWELARPARYVFEYQLHCFCPRAGTWWRATVRGDSTADLLMLDSSASASRDVLNRRSTPLTVDHLFDLLERSVTLKLARIRVKYDPRWHFPVFVDADPILMAVDDEWELTIRRFEALPD